MNISKHFGGKLIDMEPELEPGFDLNYPVPLSKELPGFSGSGSEPGSITNSYKKFLIVLTAFPLELKNK